MFVNISIDKTRSKLCSPFRYNRDGDGHFSGTKMGIFYVAGHNGQILQFFQPDP